MEKSRSLGIVIIVFAIIYLLISISHYFNVPTMNHLLIVELIWEIVFLFVGILIFFKKKIWVPSIIILMISFGFFMNAVNSIGITSGHRSLVGAIKAQHFLIYSGIIFVIGFVLLFLKRENKVN